MLLSHDHSHAFSLLQKAGCLQIGHIRIILGQQSGYYLDYLGERKSWHELASLINVHAPE